MATLFTSTKGTIDFIVNNDKSNVQPSKKKELIQSLLSQSHSLNNLLVNRNSLSKQVSTKNILSNMVTNNSNNKKRQSLQRQQTQNVINKSNRDISLQSMANQKLKIDATKDMIMVLQNKLTQNKKSKSVENLLA